MRVLIGMAVCLWASVAGAGTLSTLPSVPGPLRATDAVAAGRTGDATAYKMTLDQISGYVLPQVPSYQCWSSASGGKTCAGTPSTMNVVGATVTAGTLTVPPATITPEWFGYTGTNPTADTAAIQAAVNSLSSGGTLMLNEHTYTINSAIVLPYNYIRIVGKSWGSKIVQTADVPVFMTPVVNNSSYSYTTVENMEISTASTSAYTIDFYNSIKCGVVNVHLTGPTGTTSNVSGVRFYAQSASNTYFENYVKDSFLQNASVVMRTTDGQVTNSIIWGNTRSFALHLGKGQQQIIGNQIMGSPVNGGIWVKDIESGETTWSVDMLDIKGNFFDGASQNQATVPTGWGIFADAGMINSVIDGNVFYHHSYGGINVTSGYSSTISNNVFNINNKSAGLYPDILFTGAVTAYTISGNNFARNDTGGGTYGSAIKTTAAANSNIYSSNSVTTSYYLTPIFDINDAYGSDTRTNSPLSIVGAGTGDMNTLSALSMTLYIGNASSGNWTNSPSSSIGTAVLTVTAVANGYATQTLTEVTTGRVWVRKYASTWSAWARVGVAAQDAVILSSGDYNTLTDSGVYYIGSSSSLSNGPSPAFSTALLRVTYLSSGYCIQDILAPVTGARWSRFLNNSVWGGWTVNN